MCDFMWLGWDLAFKYRTPAMLLADGLVGQMMEKVVLPEPRPRRTEEQVRLQCPWAINGRKDMRKRNVVTSLELVDEIMEQNNLRFQRTYREIEKNEVRYEAINTDGCDYLFVAFGSMARICQKVMEMAEEEGIKIGLLRPITLWPFPAEQIKEAAKGAKGIMVVELSAGQMIEDVKLAVECNVEVKHYGRLGGIVPTPEEVLDALKNQFAIVK